MVSPRRRLARQRHGTLSPRRRGADRRTLEPPKLWEGLSSVMLNAALTEIDNGMSNGQRYTDKGGGRGPRAAWRVVQKHCADRSEGQCREIIKTWIKNGVLYEAE